MDFRMGGICGRLCLGLGQEQWMDCHWESHLVQNIDLREAPLVRYQVENLRVQNYESLVLRYAPSVICQVETEMVSLRVLHWERSSYLVHNVELR